MRKATRNLVLAAECWLELARASAFVRLFPSKLALGLSPAASPVVDLESSVRAAKEICLWVDRAASRHVKRMTCLERAVAGQRVLARRNLKTELRIGVRMAKAEWEAHAWLSLHGVSLDRQREAFDVMTTMPKAVPLGPKP